MRQHSGGGIIGLKNGFWKRNLLILFLFSVDYTFPQIPINGFCKYDSYTVPSGYSNLAVANVFKDSFDDLILYNPGKKKYALLKGTKNGFTDINQLKIKYEISALLTPKSGGINKRDLIFISRKNRLLGEYRIKLDMPPGLINKLGFNSFPGNISEADINDDGIDEFMIFGAGFEGISLIYKSTERFGERKIVSGSSFSSTDFIELNDDGYIDIAAFNIIENTIQFFYNDGEANFHLTRSIPLINEAGNLTAVDFDNDGYDDLIFAMGGSLKILYGDFQASYETSAILNMNFSPDDFIVGEFNKDGLHDIAYINTNEGILSVLFNDNGRQFYDELVYMKKPGLNDLQNYNVDSENGIAVISEEGKLYTVTTISEIESIENINLIPGIKAITLSSFDNGNDNITDLCFIDSYDQNMKIFMQSKNNVPSLFYSIPTAENHNDIIIDDTFDYEKTFYCYSDGSQLIEVFKVDFLKNKIERKQLYAPGEIKDSKIERVDSTLVNIHLAYNKSNKLFLGKFEHRRLSTTFRELPFIDRNVINAQLFIDENPIVYYWKEEMDSVHLYRAEILTGADKYHKYFSLFRTEEMKIITVSADLKSTGGPSIMSFIDSENRNFMISSDLNGYSIYPPATEDFRLLIEKENRLFFGDIDDGGKGKLTVYTTDTNSLNMINVTGRVKKYSLIKLLDREGVGSYFIDNFVSNNFCFIYSNTMESCISLIRLKK